ncbi:M24 family metallopeptidase [Streptomyces sp. NPDC052042]|uniref:M24 family metallopeptidase n=1 Tax=Streptomyces sp. NPDC052042 TaxID=3365683 RepID=UPI0037D3652F
MTRYAGLSSDGHRGARHADRFHTDRCVAELRRAGVDGVVATSVENVVYLTGYDHWPLHTFREHGVYAVVTASGERGLVAPRNAGEYLVTDWPADCTLVTYGDFFVSVAPGGTMAPLDQQWASLRESTPHHRTAAEALTALTNELGLGPHATVALDDQALSTAGREGLRERFRRAEGVDANMLLRRVRRVKTPHEVALLREVANRTEKAMNGVFSRVREGISETEMFDLYRRLALEEGLNPGHCEVNTGLRASGCFPPDSTSLVGFGDTVRIDCGAQLEGYHSDTGRNATLGTMSARLSIAEDAIRAGIQAMFDMAGPGVPVAELARTAIDSVRKAGLPEYERHHVGHGIGLEMYEYPVLSPRTDPSVVLVEGEVLNFELPFYEMGTGGLQIEDTVLVTSSGVEVLTTNSRSAFRAGAQGHAAAEGVSREA